MASKADLWVELRNAIKLIDEAYKYATETASVNFATLYNTLQGVYTGSNVLSVETAAVTAKNSFIGIINNTGLLTPIILELARIGYSSRATAVSDALNDIFIGMTNASETVRYRNMTNGSIIPDGSNYGTGQLIRLVKNAAGSNIESGQYQSGNVICEITGDRIYSGATDFREPALIRGNGAVGIDAIDKGTSPSGSLTLNAKVDLNGLTNNAGWLTYSDNGTSITITNWTLANTTKATHVGIIEDDFRDGTNTLSFTDNNSISQDSSFWSAATAGVPYLFAAWVKPDVSCDGNIDLRLGDITKTIAVSTLSPSVWNLVTIDINEDCWYDNWKYDTVGTTDVGLELKNRTAGQLDIANFILTQFAAFDSKYYVLLSGDVPFQKGDYFTMTDSSLNTGRIQSTIARLYGKYLPHINTGETYADL